VTPPAETTAPPTSVPERKGLAPGERYEQLDATGQVIFSITVDRMVVDVPCTGARSLPAENGHLIGVKMHVQIGPGSAADKELPAITAADFRFVGADDVAVADVATASATACLDEAGAWPDGSPTPEEPTVATIVLDVPAVPGTIVYRPVP
jgi:hypothetical protein